MLDTIHYTLGDCIEGMKQFPDGFFDLAVVDPPYGDAGGYGAARKDSEDDSTGTARRYNRFGTWFDRYKKVCPVQQQRQTGKIYNFAGGVRHHPNRRNLGDKVR